MTLDKIMNAYQTLEVKHDVYQLLETLDIKWFYQDIKEPAKLFTYQDYTMIIVKDAVDHEVYYLLHEIGHYLLHKGESLYLYGNSKAEYEADLFACVYLLHGELSADCYEMYLVDQGVPACVITRFRDMVYQYQQVQRYGDIWMRLEC